MRFGAFVIIVLLAVASAASLRPWLGFTPDLPLAGLIAAAAFLSLGELAALALLAIWLLGFVPVLSAEAAVFFFFPLFWSLVHRFAPARPWLVNAAGSGIGIVIFYLIVQSWAALRESFLLSDVVVAVAAAAAVFAAARPLFPLSHERQW